jgi:uncharacterized phage protein gp47/JayE
MSTSPLGTPIPSIDELRGNAERLMQQSLASAQQSGAPLGDLSPADVDLARSNTKTISVVFGMAMHAAYRYLRDFIARQAIPIKSSGEFLAGWLATYGMAFKPASAASGSVTGTGVAATLLQAGVVMQTVDGRQYAVMADVAVGGGGAVTAQVLALVAGAAGNLSGGTVLTLVSAVAGIDATFAVDMPNGITGGADAETEAQAIYRLQQRLSNEPMGGSPADYARWALQVAGITRAWGVRNPAGPTTAGVIIMADGNPSLGLPTTGQQQLVLDYIRDPMRGPPDELFVIIPTPVTINVTVNVTPDTAAIRAAAVVALKDLFFREAVPGGSMPHSHLKEAISSVIGEYNHTISVPALTEGGVFTVGTYDSLLVLGTVTFV